MRAGYYPKLAIEGIRKNRRMYLPYLFTSIAMTAMYYIIVFLQDGGLVSALPLGSETVREMMRFGGNIMAFFSCIFLFYTNSFLIRRRKKEFGLYNILGMGKKNIARILFWETLFILLLSLGSGLLLGIVLSKTAELGLFNLMGYQISYRLSVSVPGVCMTALVFGVIFVLLFFNALRQVRFSSAMALLQSENAGEKPPKANWLLGFLGLALLGGAYYISATIEDPITALAAFFGAVLMVIAGTYLTMISGSVMFCRILQRRRKYYYRPEHFVSVASMKYRMKRNGAGLASICILATMVLVILSATTCLYFGGEDVLRTRYPREINFSMRTKYAKALSDEVLEPVWESIDTTARQQGASMEQQYRCRSAIITGLLQDGTVECDVTKVRNAVTFSDVIQFYFVPLADYNAITGAKESLASGEALICGSRTDEIGDMLEFRNGSRFQVKGRAEEIFPEELVPEMTVVVADLETTLEGLNALADFNGDAMLSFQWIVNFDTGLEKEEQMALSERLSALELPEDCTSVCRSREWEQQDFYSLFGGLFYLGILLSIVFVFAAVLIIYYKQISEGYEDQARFEIMQKVGMTKREIRKSINSQLLTVFFLPLGLAALHLCFAFPIIRKLMLLFQLNNVRLYLLTTLLSVIAFALFYTLVYRVTSNAYYHIVSGAKEKREV